MSKKRNKAHAVKRKKCGAKTRDGGTCKNWAMPNGRCRMHGGKSTGAPPEKMKKNSNARTHGLFAKYLPEETLEIMNSINNIDPLDILWTNIQMQFASIIRAQQIMFVESKDDTTKEMKKLKIENVIDSEGNEIQVPIEKEYELQFAWDKQATFMNSLSRSMAELRNMLKQYVELSTHDDDRLLEVQRMQSIIDKNKAEIDKIKQENVTEAPPQITIVDEWADEDDGD